MLGFLGGTGPEGKGLALRFAQAGHEVLIGSRDLLRAQQSVEEIHALLPQAIVRAKTNLEVAQEATIVFITVPFSAQTALLEPLKAPLENKVIVSTSIPLQFTRSHIRAIPVDEGCAALQVQTILPTSKVVGAFQNVSATDLLIPETPIHCDVVVCSDDADAKGKVMALAQEIEEIRAIDGGALENSRYVEDFTALLLNINRIYKGSRTMIRISGFAEPS